MSILNKVGPLGEKVGRSLFGNVGEAVRSFSNTGGIGEALTAAQSLTETGSSDALMYPLDVIGNPAYPATIRFKVMRYGSPTEQPQKQMDKTIEDNLKKQGATPFFADDTVAANTDFSNAEEFNDATDDALAPIGVGKTLRQKISSGASQLFGSVAQTQLGKSVSTTLQSGMRFLEERDEPIVMMYYPMSTQFNDNALYDNVNLGASGAIAEAALNSGLGVTGAVVQNLQAGVNSLSDVLSANPQVGRDAMAFSVSRINSFFGGLLGGGIQNTVSLQARIIINPNARSIFRGVNLREFSFQFKFIATSAEEARAVENIVKHFRKELYPDVFGVTIGDQEAAVGFKFPNAFKISFQFKGVDSSKIPQIKPAYLRNVSHTINPTGGGFRNDGQPNEIDLSLQFVEHETITKKDVIEGGF
tara:strand:- start:6313 stop:7563 length:1251 start_codon:yes stop_codon:yes gene_type:complete